MEAQWNALKKYLADEKKSLHRPMKGPTTLGRGMIIAFEAIETEMARLELHGSPAACETPCPVSEKS